MSVKTILSLLLLSLLPASVMAENARLPYRMLYEIQKTQREWNHTHTNLLAVMVVRSTSPDVKVSDLSAYLETKDGKIPVEIGSAGEFTLPMREDLLAEDPWLITNQPKGTMRLNWQLGVLPGHLGKSVHYARLMQPVRESDVVQEQMHHFFPDSPRLTVTGLKLTFSPGTKTLAVIHTRGGERKLTSNEQGEIILPLVAEWLDEDPEITLTDVPAAVEIVSRPKTD